MRKTEQQSKCSTIFTYLTYFIQKSKNHTKSNTNHNSGTEKGRY